MQYHRDAIDGFQALRLYVRPRPVEEHCELCAAPIPAAHQHLFESKTRALVCACNPCAILFSTPNSKYRRVPRRVRLLRNFRGSDQLWQDLAIPINMAYFYHDSEADLAKAAYPGPAGATESQLEPDAWRDVVAANSILAAIEPDVEALLVNRLGLPSGNAAAEHFLIPIDECFKLVGLIRSHWRGLAGGTEVWRELSQYFTDLRQRAVLTESRGVEAARA